MKFALHRGDSMTHYINGKWLSGKGKNFSSINPATNEILWEGQAATEEEVHDAVTAAETASKNWALLSFQERLNYLENFCKVLEKASNSFATVIAREIGKPLWEAKQEITSMLNKLKISVEAYQQRSGETIQYGNNRHTLIQHRPHGVLAVLGPFNLPGHLPNGHIMPALLAGNTLIFKPSEFAPLVAEKMVQYWEEAGLPPGVFNLVQGNKITGLTLAKANIKGLLFTGSYAAGQSLHQQFAGFPEKLLVLEMGGNNPLVAFDVHNSLAAAYLILQSTFLTSGQRCTAARRLLIPANVDGDEIISQLITLLKKVPVGIYTNDPEPFMGPVIHSASAEKILQQQQALIKQGAQPLLEATHLTLHTGLMTPGLIDVTPLLNRSDEEIFGPLLQVIRCPDFMSAIQESNQTRYGLTAGLISDNPKLFKQFYAHIRAGIINWNTPLTGSPSDAPFGGIGHSGNQRPSAFYAADYCAYPVTSVQTPTLTIPTSFLPGMPS